MHIGTTGQALDTLNDTRAAILQALSALDAIHNDEKLKLPPAHSRSLQAAVESLEELPDELEQVADHVETLAATS